MENNEHKPEEKPVAAHAEKAGETKVSAAAKKCGRDICKHKKYILGVIVLLLIVGYVVYQKNPAIVSKFFTKNLTQDEAKAKTLDFIEKNLVAPGTKVDIKSISDENGLYKIVLNVSGQEITSYLTKDGSKFFPQAMDIAQVTQQTQASSQQAAAPKDVPKSDTPDVKLFVMSYCPFGTQMEKGILPAVQALGAKIKYSLEFVDYSMHNDAATGDRKELDENLRQYCIEKNQPTRLNAYLTCFLKKGQGTESACMQSAGVNAAQVTSCMAQTDTQFDVTKDFADKSTWSNGQFPPFNVQKADNEQFGVQGSPTLIINGVQAQPADRDPANILKTICAAFNTPPKECSTKLSATAPAAGFGEGAAPATGAAPASCATPAAPAAPAQ